MCITFKKLCRHLSLWLFPTSKNIVKLYVKVELQYQSMMTYFVKWLKIIFVASNHLTIPNICSCTL